MTATAAGLPSRDAGFSNLGICAICFKNSYIAPRQCEGGVDVNICVIPIACGLNNHSIAAGDRDRTVGIQAVTTAAGSCGDRYRPAGDGD